MDKTKALEAQTCANCGRSIFQGEPRYVHSEYKWYIHVKCQQYYERDVYGMVPESEKRGSKDAKTSATGTE